VSLSLVCQYDVRSALNICAVIAMLFSEDCIGVKKVNGLKKLGERV
jgi:hypothetical protein